MELIRPVIVSAVLTLSLASVAIADPATLARFKSEAPAGWKRIIRAYADQSFQYTTERKDYTGSIEVSSISRVTDVHRLGDRLRMNTKASTMKRILNPDGVSFSAETKTTSAQAAEILNEDYYAVIKVAPERNTLFTVIETDELAKSATLTNLARQSLPSLELVSKPA